MTDKSDEFSAQATYIDAPQNPIGQSLYQYWIQKRGTRPMPARSEINPAEFKALLPNVIIWSVGGPGEAFMTRLVGDNIVRFVGKSTAGRPATDNMEPQTARAVLEVLNSVVVSKSPRFRSGKTYWLPQKSFHDFEASFLPLSADGETVNMILGAISFETKL